mmetsp:Transcript_79611/g.231102  ORF Transcript_79611/g.231102 Transcript_79611/m.231102 type:complete len:84 (-) Transcript_79611:437-688(-)
MGRRGPVILTAAWRLTGRAWGAPDQRPPWLTRVPARVSEALSQDTGHLLRILELSAALPHRRGRHPASLDEATPHSDQLLPWW